MKLSDKLRQLQEEAREDELSHEAIEDGFNRCIEDAEFLEERIGELSSKVPSRVIQPDVNNLEKLTEHNSMVVSQFMAHCNEHGCTIPDEMFESYFGA